MLARALLPVAILWATLAATPAAPAQSPVDLQQRLGQVEVEGRAGDLRVRVWTDAGEVSLTPEEYVAAIRAAQEEQRSRGVLYALFNITGPWGILWVSVGFLGQALFTFRMVLQWLVSEREKRSVVPVGFWWGSLFGGLMLLAYFLWRKDIVGVVGQSTGAFIYGRNLWLIYRGGGSAGGRGSGRGRGRGEDSG